TPGSHSRAGGLHLSLDAQAAAAKPDNAEVLSAPKTNEVLDAFAARVGQIDSGALTPEQFKAIMKDIQKETGVKGKDLYHPVRVAMIGAHSGPEFDKIIPIIEEGSRLQLTVHVMSVRGRVEAVRAARAAAAQSNC